MSKAKYEYCVMTNGTAVVGVRYDQFWDPGHFILEDPMAINTVIGPSGVNVFATRYMEHSDTTFIKVNKKHVVSYTPPSEEIICMYNAVVKYTERRVDPFMLSSMSNVVSKLNQVELEMIKTETPDIKPTEEDLSNLLSTLDERTMTRQ